MILVTGATGFLGSNFVRFMNQGETPVRIFRRPGSSLENLAGCSYEDFTGDLANAADWARALKNCTTVYHLAACTSLLQKDRGARRQVNIEGTKLLAEVLKSHPGTRLVYCSSAGAVGLSKKPVILNECSPFDALGIDYFESKKKGEEIIQEAVRSEGLNAVIVNPSTILGAHGMRENQRMLFEKAARGKILFYTPGGTSVVFVEDVCRGLLGAAAKGRRGERYLLAGHNIRLRDYLNAIAHMKGFRGPAISLPAIFCEGAGAAAEMLAGKLGRDTGRLASVFGYYQSDKAASELGYTLTPLDHMLQAVACGLERKSP